jgi:hypothetical protein
MFASVLQEHLGLGGRGDCIFGKIKHLTMAKDVRTRVQSRIRHISYFSSLFQVSLLIQSRCLIISLTVVPV